MSDFIDVRYRDHREGAVDDVTLNELILTGKVKQFFRPSEGRWVDVDSDAIRLKESLYEGPERRKPILNRQDQEFASHKPTEDPLTAQDWYARGFSLLRTTGTHYEAIRAFATAIQLDPLNAKAYLNRGMAYEQMNNMKQAYEDYGNAIQLLPDDSKAYYMRGMLLWRYGKHTEAIIDLNASAELGYRLAIDFFKRRKAYS